MKGRYFVSFPVQCEINMTVDAEDKESAKVAAWEIFEEGLFRSHELDPIDLTDECKELTRVITMRDKK